MKPADNPKIHKTSGATQKPVQPGQATSYLCFSTLIALPEFIGFEFPLFWQAGMPRRNPTPFCS